MSCSDLSRLKLVVVDGVSIFRTEYGQTAGGRRR